jgi:hypothetical protein
MTESMQDFMASDLSQLFTRDMPEECRIGSRKYTVLLDDLMNDEVEGYGGPESIEMQRVHFRTSDKASIEDGSKLFIKGKSKIVLSSVISADGNELIATVRGD